MSRTVDRILALLDNTLESSAHVYGSSATSDVAGCVRGCGATPADGHDFCDGCRAFVLGDTDADPVKARERQ